MKKAAKSLLFFANRALGHLGVQVVSNAKALEFSTALQRLKGLGFKPATIFDIGVAYGTPDLYRQFKSAKFFLVDPVPQSLPYMQKWAKTLNASIHNVGLGEVDAFLRMDVPTDIGGSSLFQDIGTSDSSEKINIPIKRFDSIFGDHDLIFPCLVKIDVQGAELSVLKGMGKLLEAVDLLIVEVRCIVTQMGASHMFEVVDYLRTNHFTIYDVCGLSRRPLDGALTELDIVFCKNTSALLQDRRWRA